MHSQRTEIDTQGLTLVIALVIVLIMAIGIAMALLDARMVRIAAEEIGRLKRFTASGMEGHSHLGAPDTGIARPLPRKDFVGESLAPLGGMQTGLAW